MLAEIAQSCSMVSGFINVRVYRLRNGEIFAFSQRSVKFKLSFQTRWIKNWNVDDDKYKILNNRTKYHSQTNFALL
jgi:hypothetical protein